jgi:hypothetical protein
MEDSIIVKWERQGPHGEGRRGRTHLHAILVDRTSGKEAHYEKVIDHLASIEERFLETKETGMRAFHRGLFWSVAGRRLDALHLDSEVRQRIETEISEVVPRPSEEWGLWAVTCVPKDDK